MERTDAREDAGGATTASPEGRPADGGEGTGTDDETILAVLAHLVPFPFEAAFFFIAEDSEFVRYHAAHSLAYSLLVPVVVALSFAVVVLAAVAVPLVLAVLGLVVGLLAGDGGTGLGFGVSLGVVTFTLVPMAMFVVVPLVLLVTLGVWAYFVLAAVGGRRPRVPVVSTVADVVQRVAEDALGGERAPAPGRDVRRG